MASDESSKFMVAYTNGDLEIRHTRTLEIVGRLSYKESRQKTEISGSWLNKSELKNFGLVQNSGFSHAYIYREI
jgi:hypothetical protein